MEFSVNHPLLFVLVGIVIAAVLGQSIFFLVRAYRRAKAIGMDMSAVKKTISSSAIFTIAPAVSILVGVIVLSKSLGIPAPWLRLSVIGSLSYETIAANTTLNELGQSAGTTITEASQYVTILWVMTLGILVGLIMVPLFTKKIQGGIINMEKRDKKWSEIFNNSMFMGMISAFLGYVFCDVGLVVKGDLSGLIPVCVMVTSAVVMAICGTIATKCKIRWLTDYALPMSLIAGMASAIPFTMLLGG